MMQVRSKLSNLGQGNGSGESHEDTTRSPRIKSFPAERINRLRPPENMDTSRHIENRGQGDTLARQSDPQSHSMLFPLLNENISSMSEQQVPRVNFPVNEQVSQSHLVISSPTGISTCERPPHRPHVPHTNTTTKDQSPKKCIHPIQLTRASPGLYQSSVPDNNQNEPHEHHYCDPWRTENDSIKPLAPGNDTLNDRYPSFFRPSVQADWNESITVDRPAPQCSITEANVSNLSTVAPQQINQKHQPNNTANRQGNNNVESNLGIKSRQDVAMNQKSNWHRTMEPGSYSQNAWMQNNGSQSQTYPINIATSGNVDPNSTVCYQHFRESELQADPNKHQIVHGNCYNQQISNQAQPKPTNNLIIPDVFNRQEIENDDRKSLRFSPAMIRDQEMLVTTMRQQRIPEEIMRRQFDALLAEQRKQLLYLEQLEHGESDISMTVPQVRRVKRKISKIEEDGKPEWMLHITPPRIPYSAIEKMRSEREMNSKRTRNAGKFIKVPPPDVPQHHDKMAQENYGEIRQKSETPLSHDCSNPNVTYQTCTMIGHHSGEPQTRYYGYPMLPQLQQQQHYIQRVPQERLSIEANGRRGEIQQFQRRQQQAQESIEPSSLLKLRLHKEIIRQQKQNNGLQDPATVNEAIEALKKPANRKGLEYLEKLNKKLEKSVSLNGAQDTQKCCLLINGSTASQTVSQPTKIPPANGLDNQRNVNNPSTASMLHDKKIKESQWREYPRQRTKSASYDCYNLIAERENDTVANSLSQECVKPYPVMPRSVTMDNSTTACSMHVQSNMHKGEEFHGELKQPLASVNPSVPLTITQQNQQQYHTRQLRQLYGNPSNYVHANVVNIHPCMNPQYGFPSGGHFDKENGNVQQQYHKINNDIQEIIILGGFKYLARKPEYSPNSSSPSQHNVNPRNYFNPSVSCP